MLVDAAELPARECGIGRIISRRPVHLRHGQEAPIGRQAIANAGTECRVGRRVELGMLDPVRREGRPVIGCVKQMGKWIHGSHSPTSVNEERVVASWRVRPRPVGRRQARAITTSSDDDCSKIDAAKQGGDLAAARLVEASSRCWISEAVRSQGRSSHHPPILLLPWISRREREASRERAAAAC